MFHPNRYYNRIRDFAWFVIRLVLNSHRCDKHRWWMATHSTMILPDKRSSLELGYMISCYPTEYKTDRTRGRYNRYSACCNLQCSHRYNHRSHRFDFRYIERNSRPHNNLYYMYKHHSHMSHGRNTWCRHINQSSNRLRWRRLDKNTFRLHMFRNRIWNHRRYKSNCMFGIRNIWTNHSRKRRLNTLGNRYSEFRRTGWLTEKNRNRRLLQHEKTYIRRGKMKKKSCWWRRCKWLSCCQETNRHC